MPKWNADVLEVLIGQISEYRNVYFVTGKTLRVLGYSELFEPVANLLHRGPRRIIIHSGPAGQKI